MSIRTRLFAATYDRFMKSTELGLAQHRATLLAAARGDVLEIGAGTGVNLGYYGDDVASLTLTEPDPAMLKRLQQRVDQSGRTATVLRAPAEDLPFDDERFDVVVSTLVLCGVDDQPRALREARRVVRPGGHLLFMEHVRSDTRASRTSRTGSTGSTGWLCYATATGRRSRQSGRQASTPRTSSTRSFRNRRRSCGRWWSAMRWRGRSRSARRVDGALRDGAPLGLGPGLHLSLQHQAQ